MRPVLEVRDLTKDFGGRTLLQIAELALAPGEVYVLTGGNGAGKSTLLRILAGLEPARAGAFRYAGQALDLAAYPRWLRHEVIYVHQHPYLFHTSIAGNIDYGLRLRGLARAERERQVTEAMAWAGVAHLNGTPPQKLSGGEKQRVALARARVLHPRVMLLDEPTASLDAEARAQIVELLDRLADRETSVVIACHDREIIRLPHVLRFHLEGGRLAREGAGC